MVVVRLKRGGAKRDPYYRIVAAESGKKRDGRNVEEIIRTVKALRAGGKTGCDWEPGDDLL